MTFPQSVADQFAINGFQFWRLNTPLSSMGDLYESAQGALAFALGPNSDIANFRVSYFDEMRAGGVGTILLSPDRSFVGRVDARNEVSYIESVARAGRVLISVDDIYNTAWRPADFDDDTWELVPPELDVIQYFINPPSLIPQRSDKTFRFQYLQPPINGAKRTFIGVPAYGRKSGTISIKNYTASTIANVGVFGVKFFLTSNALGTTYSVAAEGTISAPADLAGFGQRLVQFTSQTQGGWDYIYIGLGGDITKPYVAGSIVPISITLSDDL